MNQRIKRVRENVANSLLSTYTPSDRRQGMKVARGPSLRGDTGSSGEEVDCIHSDARVKCVKCIPKFGNTRTLTGSHRASSSPDPLRMLCTSHGCTLCNQVALICCVHSLLVLYFHQPRPADLFQVRHYH